MITPKSTLTEAERFERDALESIIAYGVMSFVEVGNALLTIAEKRLYRETHGSFEPYCREKWSMSARRAYQLCEASKVVASVNNCSQSVTTESQARELAKVEPEQREAVLSEAAANGKLTAKAIRKAARVPVEVASEPVGAPTTQDAAWLSAMGNPEVKPTEPCVTEYYTRLERLVEDALENATDKQLNSMSVYAKIIPAKIKEAIQKRKEAKQ